ncbi:LysR family transcriptional regulator [Thalassotalea sediminis]|uniref:LysR family transcriptional regulator n=1 Tax=Thalassotalea sediminis TaxID=1759089 RepID=UPI00257284FB|nr:LysR family transcriptional regulator [Thalassotalea sediminis]
MIDDLKSMAVFAEVVRFGSFRSAAKSLALSPSVISYHISQLETKLNTALLYRSTRSLSLTSQGEEFFQHVQTMLSSAQMGLDQIHTELGGLSGRLTISLPTALIRAPLTEKIVAFSNKHPQVDLSLHYTDEQQNIIAQGIDLAIRAGRLEDSGLKAKRIGEIERCLVCSEDYFAKHNKPIAPQNLMTWRWIKLSMLKNERTFTHHKHANAVVKYRHKIAVNSVDAMTELALLGAGLATPPSYLVKHHIESGKLIHVLPDWQIESIPLYALWPANIAKQSLTLQLLNFIQEIEYA